MHQSPATQSGVLAIHSCVCRPGEERTDSGHHGVSRLTCRTACTSGGVGIRRRSPRCSRSSEPAWPGMASSQTTTQPLGVCGRLCPKYCRAVQRAVRVPCAALALVCAVACAARPIARCRLSLPPPPPLPAQPAAHADALPVLEGCIERGHREVELAGGGGWRQRGRGGFVGGRGREGAGRARGLTSVAPVFVRGGPPPPARRRHPL